MACHDKKPEQKATTPWGTAIEDTLKIDTTAQYALSEILESGAIRVITVSGEDTYFTTAHGAELGVRNRLAALEVEHFVPTTRTRGWRGRTVEKPVINCLLFIRATQAEALALIHERGLKADYLFDCATHRLMVVPDKAMDDFRRVLDLSTDEGGLIDRPLQQGEKVRVMKGPLEGVEGRILELQGKNYVVVSLLDSLFTRAAIPRAWLEIR